MGPEVALTVYCCEQLLRLLCRSRNKPLFTNSRTWYFGCAFLQAAPQLPAALGAPPAPATYSNRSSRPVRTGRYSWGERLHPILPIPNKLPGKSSDDITSAFDPLDVAVPQKVQDQIWARQYVDLTALLREDEQEMEL